MHYEAFVHGFSSFENFNEVSCAQRYSRMKFGDNRAAMEIGYEMADLLFNEHSDLLLANNVVVIPSPYNYVKNAATVVTEHMIDRLNCHLVNANGKHVEYSIIHRKVSYIADYGFLSKDKREQLLSNDKFYLNKDFLKGKLLIFVDDIKITGTHEEKLVEVLDKENMDNDVVFVYSARYFGSNPEIEAQLNFAGINSVEEYVELATEPDHNILVRPIKFLLKQKPVYFRENFVYKVSMKFLRAFYHACIGEGYTIIPEYQENIRFVKETIDG